MVKVWYDNSDLALVGVELRFGNLRFCSLRRFRRSTGDLDVIWHVANEFYILDLS